MPVPQEPNNFSVSLNGSLIQPIEQPDLPDLLHFPPEEQASQTKMKPAISIETFEEAAAQLESNLPPRYCSIKGCKTILPGSLCYKMCEPCRNKYRHYGSKKRNKHKDSAESVEESPLESSAGDHNEVTVRVCFYPSSLAFLTHLAVWTAIGCASLF